MTLVDRFRLGLGFSFFFFLFFFFFFFFHVMRTYKPPFIPILKPCNERLFIVKVTTSFFVMGLRFRKWPSFS